jgi:hypothetical protein
MRPVPLQETSIQFQPEFVFNHTSGTTTSDGRCGKMVSIGVELLVGLMVHRTVVASPLVSLSLSLKSYTRPSSNGRANKTFASQNEWFLEHGRFSIWTSGSALAPKHNSSLEITPPIPQTGTNITQYFIRSMLEQFNIPEARTDIIYILQPRTLLGMKYIVTWCD